MKVKQLIELLKELDPEKEIFYEDHEYCHNMEFEIQGEDAHYIIRGVE